MRRSYRLLALLALMATVASVVAEQAAENCNPTVCRLPDCFCGGSESPGGLRKEETPQFVLLTFDDAVNDLNEKFFSELFKDRTNPNGCPIKVPGYFYFRHYRLKLCLRPLHLCAGPLV